MRRNAQPIVIKRSIRADASKKQGGAWKVAFADFTMAMMAFFMVMWLVEMANQSERAEISHHMRTRSVFDTRIEPFEVDNSPFPVDLGGTPSIINSEFENPDLSPPNNVIPGMSERLEIPSGVDAPSAGKADKLNSMIEGYFDSPSQMSLLTEAIQELAKELGASPHIQVDVVPSGLRVIIRDRDEKQIFARGQRQFTPFFEDLVLSLGGLFTKVKNKLVISGHTDNTPFHNPNYSNWNLSSDRAEMARRVLIAGGMSGDSVVQVSAFASTRPLNNDDPEASENRRVEILILNSRAEAELNDIFSPTHAREAMKKAAEAARKNRPVTRSGITVSDTDE